MQKVKQKMLKKGIKEGRRAVKDEIEEILNDSSEMNSVTAAVEAKMDKWLDSKMSFSAWDLVPGVGEARTIMQLKELLGSSAADDKAEEYACEEISLRIKRRRGRR